MLYLWLLVTELSVHSVYYALCLVFHAKVLAEMLDNRMYIITALLSSRPLDEVGL